MSRMIEFVMTGFGGLDETKNKLVISGDRGRMARELKNLRPYGGEYNKVKGDTYHSNLKYKAARQPITLIRFTTDKNAKYFIATAWDNVLSYSGGNWIALGSLGQVAYSDWWLIPPNILQGEFDVTGHADKYSSYFNKPFDWMIYKDILYLTDGFNIPVKTDGVKFGSWGFKALNKIMNGPLSNVIQNMAGSLANGSYYYRLTLYDSNRGLEGNYLEEMNVNIAAGPDKIWIYINMALWSRKDNYDFDNEFADKVKLYRLALRAPAVSGDEDVWRLVGDFKKGLVSYGTLSITAGGNVTGAVGTTFLTDGVAARYALYVDDGIGGWNTYQINTVPTETTMTLLNPDGQAYSGGAQNNRSYRVFGGLIDDINDRSNGDLYHNDPTNPAREDHSPPPRCKYCVSFADKTMRAFMAGDEDNPNRLYYSELDLPDYFPLDNYIDIDPDDGDYITGLVKYQGRLYIFKRRSVSIMNVDGDPYTWQLNTKILSVGAEGRRLIVDCDGILIFAGITGVYLYDGMKLTNISHREDGSNIIETWSKIVSGELIRAQAVYEPAYREFWLAVCMDDSRDLYDNSLAGLGSIYESTTYVGIDGVAPSQNNMVLCYRLDNGQWYQNPDIKASCWCVWRGQGDNNQIFRGGIGACVYRENVGWTRAERDGLSGIATGGNTTTLQDTTQSWAIDEWAGAAVYIYDYSTGSMVPAVVDSNDATTLTFTLALSIDVDAHDLYIIERSLGNNPIVVKYRTPMLGFGSIRNVKAFVEFMMRVYGAGVLTVSWTVNGESGHGGSMQFTLSQGSAIWDEAVWDTDVWSEIVVSIREDILSSDAEGAYLELEFNSSQTGEFKLGYWGVGYQKHTGDQWAH